MVKCILEGKTCELGGGYDDDDKYIGDEGEIFAAYDAIEYEPLRMEKDFEQMVRTSKVMEAELDENGRPVSKTVYVDPMDWRSRYHLLYSRYMDQFSDSEKKAAGYVDEDEDGEEEDLINNEVKKEPPRLVFVLQNEDYWPGNEFNPEAMARRQAKRIAYEQSGRCGGTPGYKYIMIASFDVDRRRYDFKSGPKTRLVKEKKVYSRSPPPPAVEGSGPKTGLVKDDNDDDDKYIGDEGEIFAAYDAIEYEPLRMEKDFEQMVRTSKVMEEELDENGRPVSKTVYVDPMDWRSRYHLLYSRYMDQFSDSEKKAAGYVDEEDGEEEDLINNEVKKEPPRLVFVLQNEDYWPGNESDPEAMARRQAKQIAYEQSGCCGGTPGYKYIMIASFDVNRRRYDFKSGPKTRLVKEKKVYSYSPRPPPPVVEGSEPKTGLVEEKKVYSHSPPPPPVVEGSSSGVAGTGDEPPKKKLRSKLRVKAIA